MNQEENIASMISLKLRQQGDYGEMTEIEPENAGEILQRSGEFLEVVQTHLKAEQLC